MMPSKSKSEFPESTAERIPSEIMEELPANSVTINLITAILMLAQSAQ